jgi:Zn-dependent protease
MSRRFKIATIRGIPLYIGSSWLVIAAMYVYLQYIGLTQVAHLGQSEGLAIAVASTLLFFGAVLAHEVAHAIMARSLDLPVSGITLLFWGGATETRAHGRGPLGEFLVAFVGPATTLVTAGLFYLIASVAHGSAHDAMHNLALIMLLFAGVNALPGFPLDGGRMLVAVVWGITRDRNTALRTAGYVGIATGVLLGAVGAWMLTHNGTLWIFFLYLAVVLIATGRGMDQRISFRRQLVRGTAAEAMRPPPVGVPAEMPLAHALDHALRDGPDEAFPVVETDGRVIGTISLSSARRLGSRDPMRPAREAMVPLNQTPVLAPGETLDEVLEWLAGRDGLVLRDGRLVGAIGPADVERWYRQVIEGHGIATFGGVPPRPDV